MSIQQPNPPDRVLRHVVLFAFNETAAREDIQGIEQAFSALPGQIETIHDFEWGLMSALENLSQGFSHCFLVTFRSGADRDSYLPHPAHQAFFVARLQPFLAKVLVFDYWSG